MSNMIPEEKIRLLIRRFTTDWRDWETRAWRLQEAKGCTYIKDGVSYISDIGILSHKKNNADFQNWISRYLVSGKSANVLSVGACPSHSPERERILSIGREGDEYVVTTRAHAEIQGIDISQDYLYRIIIENDELKVRSLEYVFPDGFADAL